MSLYVITRGWKGPVLWGSYDSYETACQARDWLYRYRPWWMRLFGVRYFVRPADQVSAGGGVL